MRFAHARPATVTLVAGSVLITATSGLSLAAVMGETPAWAHPSGYAIALDDAAATAGNQSCQPVKADDPAAHRVADATPTPTATGTTAGGSTTPTATPTATKTGSSTTPTSPPPDPSTTPSDPPSYAV